MSEKSQKLNNWNKIKIALHSQTQRSPYVNEGEVWWCATGENVGIEINCKGTRFSRPVIILKKLNQKSFLVVPLTSQLKRGNWYVSFDFQNKHQCAVLSQIKIMSIERFYRLMGTVDDNDLKKVQRGFTSLYSF